MLNFWRSREDRGKVALCAGPLLKVVCWHALSHAMGNGISTAKQTFSTSSPMTQAMFYPASPFPSDKTVPRSRVTLSMTHAQAILSTTHTITATRPRHCSNTVTCSGSKLGSKHDPGLCTSSPSHTIRTKNIWRAAKPHSVWQNLPRCMNFTLNPFAFSGISNGNTTELCISAFKDSLIRAVAALVPVHKQFILGENHTKR